MLFYGEHFNGFWESYTKIIADIQVEFTRTVCILILSVNCEILLLFPKIFLVLRIAKLERAQWAHEGERVASIFLRLLYLLLKL